MNDSTNAIELDGTNIKAYLRKGTALYNQDSKEEALKAFAGGLEIDGKRSFYCIQDVHRVLFFSW